MTTGTARFFRAVELFDAVVAQVPGYLWTRPSPCPNWSAAAVVGHVIAGMGMIQAMIGRGTSVAPPTIDPAAVAGEDPGRAWRECRKRIDEMRTHLDPGTTLPGAHGEISIDDALGQATVELLVHAWDVATATSQSVTLPEGTVITLLEMLEPLDAAIRHSGQYGHRQPTPSDASPQQRLLAFLGRRP